MLTIIDITVFKIYKIEVPSEKVFSSLFLNPIIKINIQKEYNIIGNKTSGEKTILYNAGLNKRYVGKDAKNIHIAAIIILPIINFDFFWLCCFCTQDSCKSIFISSKLTIIFLFKSILC